MIVERMVNGERETIEIADFLPEQLALIKEQELCLVREMASLDAGTIRVKLNALNWRDLVEAAVAASDQDTKDMWGGSPSFNRMHPLVIGIGLSIGKTEADLDLLFDVQS